MIDTYISSYIAALADYGLRKGLIAPADRTWAVNSLLQVMELQEYEEPEQTPELSLEDILSALVEFSVKRGLVGDDVTSRDLFDTRLMGVLTPRPSWVIGEFSRRAAEDGRTATDWYYQFSQDTDYIRAYRIARDVKWVTATEYGDLDITINLSKPEKDPRAIAAAKAAPPSGYPKCLLCRENEGYAGRLNHPARGNHRIIPVTIDRSAFRKLLDFVIQFPHYFVGSNADLPIVGGSILSHDHFQGGRYTFAMEKAPVELAVTFPGFETVEAGIVKWPMSVLRLRCGDDKQLVELADKILAAWRGYTDESAFVLAETDGEPHNTITPIARMREGQYELDLVLRNNITTAEHPMGVYHPHGELHHIKKENIGLIEVMGLAVLPARLKGELKRLGDALVQGGDPAADPELAKHADWAVQLREKYAFTAENVDDILRDEVGRVFAKVLEHAGVFKCDRQGREAFLRFVAAVK